AQSFSDSRNRSAGVSAYHSAHSAPTISSARRRSTSSVLPQAYQLPPPHSQAQPYRQVEQADDEADPPPVRLPHVAAAEEHARGAGSVVRQSGVQVREVGESQRAGGGWGAGGQRGGEECGIERGDVGGHARETVMDVEVARDQRGEGEAPVPSGDRVEPARGE